MEAEALIPVADSAAADLRRWVAEAVLAVEARWVVAVAMAQWAAVAEAHADVNTNEHKL